MLKQIEMSLRTMRANAMQVEVLQLLQLCDILFLHTKQHVNYYRS